MLRIRTILVLALPLLAVLFILSQGTAFAATQAHHIPNTTCASSPSEGNCTGQDPVAQGCQSDAYTVATAYTTDGTGHNTGYVELRYSNKCQSN